MLVRQKSKNHLKVIMIAVPVNHFKGRYFQQNPWQGIEQIVVDVQLCQGPEHLKNDYSSNRNRSVIMKQTNRQKTIVNGIDLFCSLLFVRKSRSSFDRRPKEFED